MTALSKKDREILNLRAARMSSASIAVMVGWSEAKVYNRLAALQVYSAADALDRIAGKSVLNLAGLAAFGDEAFALLLKSMVEAIAQAAAPAAAKVAPVPAPRPVAATRVEAVVAQPRPAPPRSAPRPSTPGPERSRPAAPRPARRAAEHEKPAPNGASLPPPPAGRRALLGAVRLRPVSPRVAAWAGHFRRARWSLAEVAHLFDVSEDALAVALGEAA